MLSYIVTLLPGQLNGTVVVFELLAVNDMGDVCMATPAVSGGTLFVRSQHYLFALGRKQ
jgi:hypothetical protein